jgi:hypothetical protein
MAAEAAIATKGAMTTITIEQAGKYDGQEVTIQG